MGVHVSEANDLVAEMAFCGSATVGEFVGGEAGEEELWIGWLVGVAFLGNLQMAEAAKDQFAWAEGGSVVGECW